MHSNNDLALNHGGCLATIGVVGATLLIVMIQVAWLQSFRWVHSLHQIPSLGA